MKEKSYCKQTYFKNGVDKFKQSFFGETYCRFTPKRIVIFQME